MKKMLSALIATLTASALFISCGEESIYNNNNNPSVQAPSFEEKQLYLTKYITQDSTSKSETQYFYDSNYKISKEIKITTPKNTANSPTTTVTDFKYNESGFESYRKITRSYALEYVQEIYTQNDEQGRIVTQRTVDTYNGEITSDITERYEYTDENGSFKVIADSYTKEQLYDEYGNITSLTSSYGTKITYINSYENGRLIKVTESNQTISQTTSTLYVYDKNEVLIRTDIYNLSNGEEEYFGSILYEYDNQGHKTKSTYNYSGAGTVMTEEWIYSDEVIFSAVLT